MTAKRVRICLPLAALGLLALGTPRGAAAQVTTGTIRGRVVGQDRAAVSEVRISVRNEETGLTLWTTTNALGLYQLLGLPVGGYRVTARRIGYRPLERPGVEVHIGETVEINFALETATTELEALEVVAAQPLIDRSQSGRVDLITEEAVQSIPTNGRNFADLVALSPSVQLNVGDGSGGNLSIGGGRRGANLVQIDGAGSTGTFFGGEARGSDRIPFAYSLETVQEFQVVTNDFDVEHGFFVGGLINAVTKTGTNELGGSVYGFFRGDALTGDDFFRQPPTDFSSRQFGFTLSGPIVRDKMHFFVAVERQDRDEPIFGLPAPGTPPDPSTNIHPDSVERFLDILSTVHGVSDVAGRFTQTQDETAIFGRLDWQLSNRHRLTLRHNFTDLDQQNDRISTNETRANGGIFEDRGNSTALSMQSSLSSSVFNEFRAQRATEPRPREAYSVLPEAVVEVSSLFPDGSRTRLSAEAQNDAVLPNNLEESTWELVDNLSILTGAHAIKLGAQFSSYSYENFFFNRQQGRFRFNSLDSLALGIPRDFQRALPNPGPDGQFFTSDDILPLAIYDTRELSIYAQDRWEVTDRLNVLIGARLDNTSFPDEAPLNRMLVDTLGLFTDVAPSNTYISPRIGFTYDLAADGRRLLRGGVGLFYGRFPSVLYSNALLNTGGNQLFLSCSGALAPTPDYRSYLADLTSIPTACAGGGTAAPPTANINLFADGFDYPKNWKANLGFEQALSDVMKVGFDFVYSKTTDNFYVTDENLLDEQFRSGVENRPVFAPTAAIATSNGSVAFGANRVTQAFGEVLVHQSIAEGRYYAITAHLERQATSHMAWQVSYTYANSEDNASYSCCISSTAIFETPTAGDHRFIGGAGDRLAGTWGPSDFDRRHTIVLSWNLRFPWDIQLSGLWRMTSGSPWTPTVDGDANGDGRDDNDRAFVGSGLVFADPAVDVPLLQQKLTEFDCVASQAGHISQRNVCRNPWRRTLDLRLRRAFRTVGRQEIEVVADFFNFGNLIDSDWGRNVGVAQFGDDRQLLVIRGFDPATQTYRYAVNPSFGSVSDLSPFRVDQFQMQLGLRYRF